MSADFAVATVNGRMTSDPRIFPVGKTKKVVFSLAVNRNFKDKDGNFQKKTTFVDCVAWGFPGLHVEKFGKKGAKVTLHGNLEDDSYEKDGKEINRKQINVIDISVFTAKEDAPDSTPEKESVPF